LALSLSLGKVSRRLKKLSKRFSSRQQALKRTQIYDIMKKVKEGETGGRTEGFQHQEEDQKLGVHRQYRRRGGQQQACHCEDTREDPWRVD
jgi:hypothetical protein